MTLLIALQHEENTLKGSLETLQILKRIFCSLGLVIAGALTGYAYEKSIYKS